MKLGAFGGSFATTRWTLVRAAGDGLSPAADEALEALCEAYWFPLYAYVRRHGFSKEDAEDLTQAFFAKLLERRDIAGLKRENGRFRAFLLASLKHFLANERDRAGRLKRGGNITHFSLDWQSADACFQLADAMQVSPDAAFDREWALALLARVVGMLQDEYSAEGKAERFEQLKPWLTVNCCAAKLPTRWRIRRWWRRKWRRCWGRSGDGSEPSCRTLTRVSPPREPARSG